MVEDEPTVLTVLVAALSQAGYAVWKASSAEAALRLSRESSEAVDLLLTDVMMPGMNGAELADRLLAERPGMRVLFIAGMPDTVLIRGLLARGHALLPKPFRPLQLIRKVQDVLDGTGARGATSST